MTDTTTTSFSTGQAVKAAVAMMARDPVKILVCALVFAGLPDWATTYMTELSTTTTQGVAATIGWTVAIMLVTLVSQAALQAAVTLVAQPPAGDRRSGLDGRRAGVIGLIVPLVALSLVTSLGVMAGLVLLIIPGIILSLAWYVAVPAMAAERLGVIEAIKRSHHLTRNARGAIFGLSFAFGLGSLLVVWLGQMAATALDNAVLSTIINTAAQTLIGAFGAVLAVAAYQELRQNKEGSPEQTLEAIFA
jgi:hypothetical protein